MILKCQFCDFHRERPLNKELLAKLGEPDLPHEDYLLFVDRMMRESDSNAYWGVKVHMGRMHKADSYYGIVPEISMTDEEREIINQHEVKNG